MDSVPVPDAFPAEWADDQQMAVMFSPFRERSRNPQSYERKLTFWSGLVQSECGRRGRTWFAAEDLPAVFARKGKQPHCLDAVIQDMASKGQVVSVNQLEREIGATWWSWGFNWLLRKPASWTYQRVLGSAPPRGQFVMLPLLHEMCGVVLGRLQASTEHSKHGTVELRALAALVRDVCTDPLSLRLVLMQLQREQKVFIKQMDNGAKIIKFSRLDTEKTKELSDVDISLHRLESALKQVREQIQKLMEEMHKCRLEAKYFLNQGLKNSAKNCLRKKKRLEGALQKRETAADNLHVLIQQLEDVHDNKMILAAYAAGTKAYQHQAAELTPEHIDTVMLGLQETLDMQADMNAAMSQPVEDGTPMEELEEELEALLADGATSDRVPAAASPGMDAITRGLQGLSVQSPGVSELPDVPTFNPAQPRAELADSSLHLPSPPGILGTPGRDQHLPSPPGSLGTPQHDEHAEGQPAPHEHTDWSGSFLQDATPNPVGPTSKVAGYKRPGIRHLQPL